MIQITQLNKIYKTKKRKNSHALKDITITLPDTGLVFVLGKSGSGKSTLLNLIGGLDSITSGSVIVDGNDLATFNERNFCNYRNTHIGFIFQDYHLIDELTVYENIVLSLNLRRLEDGDKVKRALEKVDLAGYEDRYPSELSGGEQQRVAIARAIVKNPRIILADEPTGNLDTNTAKSIITLLQSLSKDCLIIVVSHNINDANTYADRVIELSKGQVISDKTRNADFADQVTLVDGNLVYPNGLALTDNDIDLINSSRENKTKIVKRTDKFIATTVCQTEAKTVKIENKNLSFGKELNLSGKFLKNKALSLALSALMVAVIMVIMALAQTIIAFDAGKVISEEMVRNEQKSLLVNKAVPDEVASLLDYNYRSQIGGGDIGAIVQSGYEGNIRPVLNLSVPVNSNQNAMGLNTTYITKGFYLRESLGTLVVDWEFLQRKIGPEAMIIAQLDEPRPEGLYITDYLADCIIALNGNYRKKTYNDIIGDYKPAGWTYDTMAINGIIYTGYREKHGAILQEIANTKNFNVADFYTNKAYVAFSNDLYDFLGYSYSLDQNYLQNVHKTRQFHSHGKLMINGVMEYSTISNPYFSILDTSKMSTIKDHTITMSYQKYNAIFDTDYQSSTLKDFKPHKIKLTSYHFYDVKNENPRYTIEFTIDALHSYSDTFIIKRGAHPEIEEIVGKGDIYHNGLYLDGANGVGQALECIDDLHYNHNSYYIEGIHTMTRAVEVFVPIFSLIFVFLCVGAVFILVNFATKTINEKMHEIGILKALGTKNNTIAVIFGLQVLLIAILTCVLSTVGYYIFIDHANVILIESLKRLAPGRIVLDLTFLSFIPSVAWINNILVFVLTALSLVPPLVKIKAIKPVKIIKAKE